MSASGGSTDIKPEPFGKQNDTAPLQNAHPSDDKANELSLEKQKQAGSRAIQ